MLVEFANTRPEAFDRFRRHWEKPDGLKWPGGANDFYWTQEIVRIVWEGNKRGLEGYQIDLSLGLKPAGEEEPSIPPPIHADWEASELFMAPRDLKDVVWLTLLQHSQRLAICDNRNGGCAMPYMLKQTPKQRFCSDACALPTQREFKRRWWAEHGENWRQRRLKPSTNRRGRRQPSARRIRRESK